MSMKAQKGTDGYRPIINLRQASEIQAEQEESEKWGEVFLTTNQTLKLACINCNCIFLELASFGSHIHDGSCKLRPQSSENLVFKRSLSFDEIPNRDEVAFEELEIEEDDVLVKKEPLYDAENTVMKSTSSLADDLSDELCRNIEISDIEANTTCLETSKNDPTETTVPEGSQILGSECNASRKSSSKDKCPGKSTPSRKCRRLKKSEMKAAQMPFCAACCRNYSAGFRGHLRAKHSDLISDEEINNQKIEVLEDRIVQSLKEMACVYCNKVFTQLAEFKTHSAVHEGRVLYDCKMCDKQFSKKFSRQLHMYSHEGNRPHKCPHCPSDFIERRNLDNHIKRHFKNFEYICSCGKGFVSNYAKELHERRHAKETPFQCEECGRKFLTQSLLRKHMLRHKGIRPAKCSLCDKAFYGNDLLKHHMLTHTKEKNFSCEICNEKFPRRHALKQHSLLHEKVKRYTCDVCGKEYAQFAGLYSHKKSHGERFK